ncbi:carboxypeptidase-like regulatory domain-containing protein [Aeoliella sp. ICT_H6.2]|uniref:Carboxypeptidase-like regulatory domain-containing protein n=1 Tax=Aeoliella straminimaris TaxID=2954799 RepID=A0A9X2FAM8_9BACT|nr:carboxypeptidase-like regulatory domain-containing protein [Aeoliella straminimaris]MCO6044647.1 carboxypeptidase-like regulatory domain-containing protein [Aeoliella straminimaris]
MNYRLQNVSRYSHLFLRDIAVITVAITLLAASGCGSGSSAVSVRGKVSRDGNPVTVGQVMFHPSEGRAALGVIDSDGSYEMEEVLPGTYVVTIESYEALGDKPQSGSLEDEMRNGMGGGSGPPKIVWHLPQAFASKDSTTLSADVESGKPNEINFEL